MLGFGGGEPPAGATPTEVAAKTLAPVMPEVTAQTNPGLVTAGTQPDRQQTPEAPKVPEIGLVRRLIEAQNAAREARRALSEVSTEALTQFEEVQRGGESLMATLHGTLPLIPEKSRIDDLEEDIINGNGTNGNGRMIDVATKFFKEARKGVLVGADGKEVTVFQEMQGFLYEAIDPKDTEDLAENAMPWDKIRASVEIQDPEDPSLKLLMAKSGQKFWIVKVGSTGDEEGHVEVGIRGANSMHTGSVYVESDKGLEDIENSAFVIAKRTLDFAETATVKSVGAPTIATPQPVPAAV
jgi:hypothetical protein